MCISCTNILDHYDVISDLLIRKIKYYISITISRYRYVHQYISSVDKSFIFHLKDLLIQKSGPSSSQSLFFLLLFQLIFNLRH